MLISDWSSDVCSSELLCHVAGDLAADPFLRAGEAEGEFQGVRQPAVAADRPALARPQPLADQHQRDLAGENLVIGEPVARRIVARAGVGALYRLAPRWPVPRRPQRPVAPFGLFRSPFERARGPLRPPGLGQPL